jgi:S-adenosylmethionine decarboxylase
MHDIDPAVAGRFVFRGKYASGWHDMLGSLSCIDGSMQLDQYFFQPQGYSLNGISGKHYVTIHVTPEPEASYTSIETNRSDMNPCRIVDEVIEHFHPGRFSVFLRTSRQTGCPQVHEPLPETLGAYTTTQQTLREFDRHYTVTFTNYRRNDAFT